MTPRLETGAEASIDTSLLFAPLELTIIGELSCISRSDRRLHRMTTLILVSASSWLVVDLCNLGLLCVPGMSGIVSSVERIAGPGFVDITERDLGIGGGGGGIELDTVFILARDAGRRVAMVDVVGRWWLSNFLCQVQAAK